MVSRGLRYRGSVDPDRFLVFSTRRFHRQNGYVSENPCPLAVARRHLGATHSVRTGRASLFPDLVRSSVAHENLTERGRCDDHANASRRLLSVHPGNTATAPATAGHVLPDRLRASLRSSVHPSRGRVRRTRHCAPPRRQADQPPSAHTGHSPESALTCSSEFWQTERARAVREARPRKHRRERVKRATEARSVGRTSVPPEGSRGRFRCDCDCLYIKMIDSNDFTKKVMTK
jgi:hypothetical protein